MQWSRVNVLVTGGTGSFGKKFAEIMLREYHPQKLIVFSRGELKQHEMRSGGFDHECLRYFIGDVRDASRLRRAMKGVDVVVPTPWRRWPPISTERGTWWTPLWIRAFRRYSLSVPTKQ
jgi:uncharacterized protein YbjT (DUF2867 family)